VSTLVIDIHQCNNAGNVNRGIT